MRRISSVPFKLFSHITRYIMHWSDILWSHRSQKLCVLFLLPWRNCICQGLSLCLLPCGIMVCYQRWCTNTKGPRGWRSSAFLSTMIRDCVVRTTVPLSGITSFHPLGPRTPYFCVGWEDLADCDTPQPQLASPAPFALIARASPQKSTTPLLQKTNILWEKNRGDQGHLWCCETPDDFCRSLNKTKLFRPM